jgi:thioredoxin reductase
VVENLVIIGSGPAGYTAAIYAGRAQLKPLVFEGFSVGGIPGGQLMTTTQVENYPGFSEGIQGPRLMQQMRQQAVQIQHTRTSEVFNLPVRGLFYAIGHTPNTQLFVEQLELDEAGYIKTQGKSTATNIPGIWAAGDVQDRVYRQAITAAGTGCMAALEAEWWLSLQQSPVTFAA